MEVDLSACVAKLFASLDLDGIIADLNAPVETDVELVGRSDVPAPEPARR